MKSKGPTTTTTTTASAAAVALLMMMTGPFRCASSYVIRPPFVDVATTRRQHGALPAASRTTATDAKKAAPAMRTRPRSSEQRDPALFRLGNGNGNFDTEDDNRGNSNGNDEFLVQSGKNVLKNPQQDQQQLLQPANDASKAAQQQEPTYDFMDDLTPPPVNFSRNSILFSENPSTKLRNNTPLRLWRFARKYLPAFVTGAWPWRDTRALDERPLAALYNALIVRLPVLVVALAYLYQKIAEGHDLVIDLGFDSNGPQAVPPALVLTVLILILL